MCPTEAEKLFPRSSKECELSGVDVVVDCTGFPPALEKALRWMKRGGVVCVYGCAPPGFSMRSVSVFPPTGRFVLLF